MGEQVRATRLHRGGLRRQYPLTAEHRAERGVRPPGLSGAPDPERASRAERHLSGALDLDEARVDGIVDPNELEVLSGQRSAYDLRARVVGLEPVAYQPPRELAALAVGDERRQLDRHQIARPAVEGSLVLPVAALR